MLRTALTLIGLVFLTACETTTFETACPTLFTYSAEKQDRAAGELLALPEDAVLVEMFGDYAIVRQEIRVCLR